MKRLSVFCRQPGFCVKEWINGLDVYFQHDFVTSHLFAVDAYSRTMRVFRKEDQSGTRLEQADMGLVGDGDFLELDIHRIRCHGLQSGHIAYIHMLLT